MAPRPRCPVCNSKKWHRDRISSSIVCEEGHLLLGYIQESTESTNYSSQFTTQTRRLKKRIGPKIARVKPSTSDLHFQGDRAEFLLFQCLQLILRLQLSVLIEEYGWPVEVEEKAKEIWSMYAQESKVVDGPGKWSKGEEGSESFMGAVRGGVRYKRSRRRRVTEEDEEVTEEGFGAAREQDSSSDSEVSSSSSESSSSSSDEDENDTVEGPSDITPKPNATERPPKRLKPTISQSPFSRPKLEHTLLIIYLSGVSLRLPIVLNDLVLMARRRELPYFQILLQLPDDLLKHLNSDLSALLTPPTISPPSSLISSLSRLILLLPALPTPSIHLLSTSLLHHTFLPLPLIRPLSNLLLKIAPGESSKAWYPLFKKRGESWSAGDDGGGVGDGWRWREWGKGSLPEVVLAIGVAVMLKSVWGLQDGESGEQVKEWLKRLQEKNARFEKGLERGLDTCSLASSSSARLLPESLWSKPPSNMNEDEIESYLDWVEDNVVPDREKVGEDIAKRNIVLDKFFPLPPQDEEFERKRLKKEAERPLSTTSTTPLPSISPPSRYSYPINPYNPSLKLSPTLPRPLHILLLHFSNLLGFPVGELHRFLVYFEKVLERLEISESAAEKKKKETEEREKRQKREVEARLREERKTEVARRKRLDEVRAEETRKRKKLNKESRVGTGTEGDDREME